MYILIVMVFFFLHQYIEWTYAAWLFLLSMFQILLFFKGEVFDPSAEPDVNN